MLADRVENPPVPVVAKAWHILSNKFIPARYSDAIQQIVSRKYVERSQRVVVLKRGCSLLDFGPVISAEKRLISPTELDGRSARVKTTIPIPPIQFVMQRQKCNPCGRESRLSITVAPVDVSPDITSKKASVTVERPPERRYGSIPIMVHDSQERVTTAKLSYLVSEVFALRPARRSIIPANKVTAVDIINAVIPESL